MGRVDRYFLVIEHQRDVDSNPTETTRPIGSVVTRTFDSVSNVLTQKEEFNTAREGLVELGERTV